MIIENEFLRVTSKAKGAELTSIFSKQTGIEYLWQACKEWTKHSPILFPIVGQLKNNSYLFNGKRYELPRHGFARDSEFEFSAEHPEFVNYHLQQISPSAIYPFQFNFFVNYVLMDNALSVLFEVENKGDEAMYFSVGGHPAFNVPLNSSENYNDYYLEFSEKENASRYLLENGLLSRKTVQVLKNENIIPLTKELFYDDALVFKNLKSESVQLKSTKSPHGLKVELNEFTSLGIWAAKDANFVCIEPWIGHADFIDHNQQLQNKEGIIALASNQAWSASYQITLF